MKYCDIYARYSSRNQDEMSIEAQIRECKKYAEANNLTVRNIYPDEAKSGKGSKTHKRKKYLQMLKDHERNGGGIILVHKYDRVARNVGEHVNLEMKLSQWGSTLIAVSQDFGTSKESKLMRQILWVLSEYYIDNLSQEVKKGHREIAHRALHNGGYAPFGYDVVEQKYVINDLEAVYVKKMFECAALQIGFKDLVAEMQAAGVTGKRGKPIKYTQIYEILRNRKYTGVYEYSVDQEEDRALRRSKPNAIRIEGALPTIINKTLFDEVQDIMNSKKQIGRSAGYLCSGLVYCGECGAKMHANKTARKGYTYYKYRCSRKCGASGVDMELVDSTVAEYIRTLLSDTVQEQMAQAIQVFMMSEKVAADEHNKKMRRIIEEKQAEYDAYMKNLGKQVFPEDVLKEMARNMSALKQEIAELKEVPAPTLMKREKIIDWLEHLKQDTANPESVRLIVERIDAKKTEVIVSSTFTSVVGKIGCGRGI